MTRPSARARLADRGRPSRVAAAPYGSPHRSLCTRSRRTPRAEISYSNPNHPHEIPPEFPAKNKKAHLFHFFPVIFSLFPRGGIARPRARAAHARAPRARFTSACPRDRSRLFRFIERAVARAPECFGTRPRGRSRSRDRRRVRRRSRACRATRARSRATRRRRDGAMRWRGFVCVDRRRDTLREEVRRRAWTRFSISLDGCVRGVVGALGGAARMRTDRGHARRTRRRARTDGANDR